MVESAGADTGMPRRLPAPRGARLDLRVVLLTVANGRLRVALTDGPAGWALPRDEPRRGSPLDAEARRIVRGATGLEERYLEQLYTLGVGTDGESIVIVSYLALILADGDGPPASTSRWFNADVLPPLADDDRMLVDYAIVRLRAKIGYTSIAFHLLPPTFTLSELQIAYEAILGRTLDKRNFRRRVIAAELIEATGCQRRDGSHRPALLYRFRADHDPDSYLTPPWSHPTHPVAVSEE